MKKFFTNFLANKVTLQEAVQQSKSMSNTSYCWIVKENILNIQVPQKCFWGYIQIYWNIFSDTYVTTAHCPYGKHKSNVELCIGLYDDKGGNTFTSLQELRDTHPKLFQVKGKFQVLR